MPLIKILIKHALLFGLIAGITVAVLMAYASDLLNQYKLVSHAQVATGSVVKPQCDQHLTFSYQFVVNGATYKGLATSDQCHQIKSGTPVSVHYLPEDPRISMGADPKESLINNVVAILIAASVVPVVLLLIFRIKLRKWEKGIEASAR
ncbi:hypothetical protein [Dyella acidisoli]|uniref:DUF3592 domain-containing protein n=1 Tax=Dyella acidisoli TaxID=1867834 RepID=A0ABQ5XKC9_9GAMM|nr:hypothetical protein [Dyella acidisoli]GLQ91538.1 hypothetical protein GCM10007901_04880 [Dyella acidisoli]